MPVCVVFRVDASLQMGTGHVMRCLTLADALKIKGAVCHFICREQLGDLIMRTRERGYQVHTLPVENVVVSEVDDEETYDNNKPAHSHWLGTRWQTDAELTSVILENLRPDWLVVDHYALDAHWESEVRKNCKKLMVIDDLADRMHDCDLLLDQTFGRIEDTYKPWVPQQCKLLTGSKYSLLRPEFAALRQFSLQRRENPKLEHILITMGGADRDNATAKVLDALKQCQLPDNCRITVVMGPNAPWLEAVIKKATEMPWETDVLDNVGDMAKLMADSDLCIGAAGSTAWERCCLGLPTLIVVLADNQKHIANMLEKAGACLNLGEVTESHFHQRVIHTIHKVINDTNLLRSMTVSAANVTDGRGVIITLDSILH